MSDVLSQFNSLVDRFTQLQGWIQKAEALASSYTPSVVANVVGRHTASRNDLLVDLIPMMVDVEQAASAADARRAAIEADVSAARAAIEELDLRQLIGDLDDAAHAEATAPHHAKIDGVRAELDDAELEAMTLRDSLARWEKIGAAAGVLTGT